jgi:transcription antitermination factor NusG
MLVVSDLPEVCFTYDKISAKSLSFMHEVHLSPWYALHVRSRHEKTVHAQLQAKQQDAFLPLYAAKNRWADRWKTVSLPLFPGYVFCRFDSATRYSVLATSGVIDVVRVGSEPAAIENSQIEAVQLIVNSQVPAEPYPHLVKGEQVMMTGGPLNGLIGTLTSIRNCVRLVLSVELLCRSVLVEIDRDWVVPLNPTYFQSFDRNSRST